MVPLMTPPSQIVESPARRPRLLARRWRSWRAHVVALLWALAVELGLRVTSLPRLARLLDVHLDLNGAGENPPPEATMAFFTTSQRQRIEAIDRVLRRWPLGDTCLRRSLLWGHALRSRAPRLRIGVARNTSGEIIAHSWLEFDDHAVSLGLDPAVDYRPFGGPA